MLKGYRKRRVLFKLIAFPALSAFQTRPSGAVEAETELRRLRRDWITDALTSRGFGEPAILSQFNDEIYYLRAPLAWSSKNDQGEMVSVNVPAGFVTDLASIPRPFWESLPRDGRYMPAAIVHDYLYWNQATTRDAADQIFKMAMQDLNVRSSVVSIIFVAVRSIFGELAWAENARLKREGELRVLTKFPQAQTIKWTEWKADRTHFQ